MDFMLTSGELFGVQVPVLAHWKLYEESDSGNGQNMNMKLPKDYSVPDDCKLACAADSGCHGFVLSGSSCYFRALEPEALEAGMHTQSGSDLYILTKTLTDSMMVSAALVLLVLLVMLCCALVRCLCKPKPVSELPAVAYSKAKLKAEPIPEPKVDEPKEDDSFFAIVDRNFDKFLALFQSKPSADKHGTSDLV